MKLLCCLALLCISCVDDRLSGIQTPVTEVYHQGGGAIDILFVVDNSGSMLEEQERLANGFATFIRGFEALQYDFRIAVTTMDAPNDRGRLVGPILQNDSQDLAGRFAEQVRVGAAGGGIEQGFEAARLALNSEFGEDEFLRAEASLAIIFVSDEDDQSFRTTATYLESFTRASNDVRVNAIVGPDRGGCSSASPGRRYLSLAEETGGQSGSICDDDLGLPELGARLSGFHTTFALLDKAIGAPQVFVDGSEVDTVSFGDNTVRFDAGTAPAQCALIEIHYVTVDRPGNGEPVVVEPEPAICRFIDGAQDPVAAGDCQQTPPSFLALLLLMLLRPRRASRVGASSDA